MSILDVLSLIASIATILAVVFAGWEIMQSVKQRRQDIRFMYAKRALTLYDMLNNHLDSLREVDARLDLRESTLPALTHYVNKLPDEQMLHEVRVAKALSEGAHISTSIEIPG